MIGQHAAQGIGKSHLVEAMPLHQMMGDAVLAAARQAGESDYAHRLFLVVIAKDFQITQPPHAFVFRLNSENLSLGNDRLRDGVPKLRNGLGLIHG
jgi:hypothetical protein